MAFDRLQYQRDWTDPGDFPAFEDSETQVRADLQFHPNAIRGYINDRLVAVLESAEAAGNIGSVEGSIQQILDRCVSDIQTLAAGGVPSVSQCVQVPFQEEDWTEQTGEGDSQWTLTIDQDTHKRMGAAFGFNLWHRVDGTLLNNTWGVAATRVSAPRAENGDITLTAPEPYEGAIVFFGV